MPLGSNCCLVLLGGTLGQGATCSGGIASGGGRRRQPLVSGAQRRLTDNRAERFVQRSRAAHLLPLPRADVGFRLALAVALGTSPRSSCHINGVAMLWQPLREPPAAAAAGGKWGVRQLFKASLNAFEYLI